MFRRILTPSRFLVGPRWNCFARRSSSDSSTDEGRQVKDEIELKHDLDLTGVHLDEIDKIMSDEVLQPFDKHYPSLNIDDWRTKKPFEGHNVMVIQPWVSYANFGISSDPDLQLEECVSLGNTIHNWNVIGKKIIFANHTNRKLLLGERSFESLKEEILSHPGVSAVFFGLEVLSGIQLASLEKALKMPVYDRFTVVLNIFRQHARTKESKIQLALAELPYIKSHLREIHESSERSAAAESLKNLVGGIGEKFYHQRLNILKKREQKLRYLLEQIRKQREVTKKLRRKSELPVVSIVGYTNSGKTSLVKYLTQDESLVPKDQLFATLDVTVHTGQLPSSKTVLYLDTVGFISRIPLLLVEAFSATLKDVQESNLIIHILDISHPDHRLQYSTVVTALEALKIPKNLTATKLTVGNKVDLLANIDELPDSLPKCDLLTSVTNNKNMTELVDKIDHQLMENMKHKVSVLRVENGGKEYSWLRRHGTIVGCEPDEDDGNFLICRVIMSPAASGRWSKQFHRSVE